MNRVFFICGFLSGLLLIISGTGCKKDGKISYGSVKDIDGNTYKTVEIGNQVWMAENLRTTKFNDGTSIPEIADYDQWPEHTGPCYCWYMNDKATYGGTYGALYSGYAAVSDKLCPAGWRVPTAADWQTLVDFHGGDNSAGKKLREKGYTHWLEPNESNNEFGFSALPGGYRGWVIGCYSSMGKDGYYWTSTNGSGNIAWYRKITHDEDIIVNNLSDYRNGFSVRCIKN